MDLTVRQYRYHRDNYKNTANSKESFSHPKIGAMQSSCPHFNLYKLGTHQVGINSQLYQPRIKQCFCLFLHFFKDSYLCLFVCILINFTIFVLYTCLKNYICLHIGGQKNLSVLFHDQSKGEKAKKQTKEKKESELLVQSRHLTIKRKKKHCGR